MAEPGSKIIDVLLDRLYATLENGPLMSCRPHASRQRVDLFQMAKLQGPGPRELLAALLGGERSVKLLAPSEASQRSETNGNGSGNGAEVEGELRGLVGKLRTIAEDARTYEEDTGTQALFVGFPLLNLPPEVSGRASWSKKRILAPIAFVPLKMTIKATRPATVTLESAAEGEDLIVPNAALLAWVERVTGKDLGELSGEDGNGDPWRTVNDLVTALATALELPAPPVLSAGGSFSPTPKSDEEDALLPGILSSAVIGLFPAAKQGLLNDLQALHDGERAVGPIESFLKAGIDLGLPPDPNKEHKAETQTSLAGSERCVDQVDPCQARAVHLARRVTGLVIHGPPGTGKSQTITNIIGDHLANGERVLFVCDKRTAVDVVAYRLERLGLGSVCAVVHDARRDQRELYRSVREQLDSLADTFGHPTCAAELARVDAELGRIHAELTEHDRALSERPNGSEWSFHELVGQWLAAEPPPHLAKQVGKVDVALGELLRVESEVKEAAERGVKEGYAENPWTGALGISLPAFLAKPHDEWKARLQRVVEAARKVDETAQPGAPAFSDDGNVLDEGRARDELGAVIRAALSVSRPERLAEWLAVDGAEARSVASEIDAATPYVELLSALPDRELAASADPATALSQITPWIGKLTSYLSIARKWYAFFLFGRRRAAREILERFGLTLGEEAASRVKKFLERLRARRMLEALLPRLVRNDESPAERALPDSELTRLVAEHTAIFRVVQALEATSALAPCAAELRRQLADPEQQAKCVDALAASQARAQAVAELEAALGDLALLTNQARSRLCLSARCGEPVGDKAQALLDAFSTLEGMVRIEARLASLATDVATLLRRLLEQSAVPDHAWRVVKRAALSSEISRRIEAHPTLSTTDGDRVQSAHQRYRDLSARRRELARDLARDTWISRQRARLLASTGSRLNAAGAEIRRRLVTRGERALRLRQMIAAGAAIEGGDPLFDLRPVWMASPDVVAQIFPRTPLFDVVIFDEASQCRLEEALPVLLRAKRVVIAGDQQQLPPTRFFETGVAKSQEQETEDEQGFFEARQAEVEDLLGAALNLSVEQAYLDVHYRSHNADLIEFSNSRFYESRLQAIPAHPSSRATVPPLRLIPVGGVYEKRANLREAEEVVKIVRSLLAESKPPSIGIACFNLAQRDAIVEALDRAAAEDPVFSARLAEARERKGTASSEHLFVRNLENVQGDERDHMIISTTYGPDARGRFYRRFGPLGQAGGGKRLNVLVTRARNMVHLVTSIPKAVYQSAPPVPTGSQPNGAWLLFAYLRYAEELEKLYADTARAVTAAEPAQGCKVLPSSSPSELAIALGERLKDAHGTSSHVHWGNDGFMVDVALVHPERPEDVTIGVLCDGSRFRKAADRVQWDIFRTEVLEGQRWQLVRVWSPQLFRDLEGTLATLKKKAAEWLATEAASQKAAARDQPAELRLLN